MRRKHNEELKKMRKLFANPQTKSKAMDLIVQKCVKINDRKNGVAMMIKNKQRGIISATKVIDKHHSAIEAEKKEIIRFENSVADLSAYYKAMKRIIEPPKKKEKKKKVEVVEEVKEE